MATGAFTIKIDPHDAFEFNMEPDPAVSGPVPDDQRELQHDIYGVIGVLKQLHEQKAFDGQKTAYDDFRRRLRQVAEVGLVGANVKTRLASSAVEQIAGEVVTRVGKKVQIRYLARLLLFVFVGVGAGLGIQVFLLPGYGAVLAASMVGAWISVAAFRREVVLADLAQFMDSKYEPAVRLFFVGLVACSVALFVKTGLLSIVVGDLKLVEFPSKPEVAVVLGLVAGISEKKISVQLIQKARQVIPSPKK